MRLRGEDMRRRAVGSNKDTAHLRKVLLPAPRKPQMSVRGTRGAFDRAGSAASSKSLPWGGKMRTVETESRAHTGWPRRPMAWSQFVQRLWNRRPAFDKIKITFRRP